MQLTPETIMYLIGVGLSLIFQYFPKLQQAYNALEDNWQKLIMVALVAVIVFGAFGLSCAGLVDYYKCSEGGLTKALTLFMATLAINQATHRVLPKPEFFIALAKRVLAWFKKPAEA